MERLIPIGKIQPKKSVDIRHSRIGLGFEKLDRNVFDPNKAYPFVAQTGVKWARIQSGWQRTEKEKGIYDFGWLDDVVDNLIAIGIEPWMCLCYGNALYTPAAAEHFGAVGCPPIHTQEERDAWARYVNATVTHFKGRIHYYEVWNEPDGKWCWKHGADPQELSDFTIATSKACKEADPSCEVLGFVTCRDNRMHFVENLASTGVCEYLDGITYHRYRPVDELGEVAYKLYDGIRKQYKPSLKLIQGETGTQSRSDGNGALKGASWTQRKQAKFLLRNLILDIGCGVDLTSYFSCMDMIEALHGKTGDVSSYQDYGYFGILGADFDENGFSTGNYTPKESFRALQNLCSVFCNEYEQFGGPIENVPEYSIRTMDIDYDFEKARSYCFRKPNGSWAVCYWNSESNLLTQTYEGTVSIRIPKRYAKDARLTDMLTGEVYRLPESITQENSEFILFSHLPIMDYPLLLTFGDFL